MKRAERIEKWLEALESGKYKQTTGRLFNNDQENPRYCCLGVACVVLGIDIEKDTNGKTLPAKAERLLEIDRIGGFEKIVKHGGNVFDSLAYLNDSGVRFKTIARIIREQMAKGNFEKP